MRSRGTVLLHAIIVTSVLLGMGSPVPAEERPRPKENAPLAPEIERVRKRLFRNRAPADPLPAAPGSQGFFDRDFQRLNALWRKSENDPALRRRLEAELAKLESSAIPDDAPRFAMSGLVGGLFAGSWLAAGTKSLGAAFWTVALGAAVGVATSVLGYTLRNDAKDTRLAQELETLKQTTMPQLEKASRPTKAGDPTTDDLPIRAP
jgi:hypothetical protein